MNNLISVIIPSYKRVNTLKESILSVCNQTYKNFEIIVVNDCGFDTKFVIDEIKEKFSEVDIKYIRHEENKGPAATKNTGIKHGNGDYIAFLDDDDLFYPEHLKTLITELNKKNNYKIAYSFAKMFSYEEKNGKLFFKKEEKFFNYTFDKDTFLFENYIPVNSFILRRELFTDKNFWFDEALKYLEDWDLWIRISREYDFLCIPEFTSEVRRVDNSLSLQYLDMNQTQLKIYKKYKINQYEYPILYSKRKKAEDEIKCAVYLLKKLKNKEVFEKASIVVPIENNIEFFNVLKDIYEERTYYYHKELIIVNSNTTDDFLKKTEEIVKKYKKIKMLHSEDKLKISQMLNYGVEYSSGEYIVFLINTLPNVYWLTSMIMFYETHRNCGIIGGKIATDRDFKISDNIRSYFKIFKTSERFSLQNNKKEKIKFIYSNILFLKTTDFFKIGKLDETIDDIGSILNFISKIKEIGKNVYYNPFSEGYMP